MVIAYEDTLSVVPNFCFILLSIGFSCFKEKRHFPHFLSLFQFWPFLILLMIQPTKSELTFC